MGPNLFAGWPGLPEQSRLADELGPEGGRDPGAANEGLRAVPRDARNRKDHHHCAYYQGVGMGVGM